MSGSTASQHTFATGAATSTDAAAAREGVSAVGGSADLGGGNVLVSPQ